MDVDEVLEKIGDFGPSQRRIYYLISLTNLWMPIFILLPSFIGADPGWSCDVDESNQLQTDFRSRCRCYEQGSCTPDYSTEFTSIVTQVRLHGRCLLEAKLIFVPNCNFAVAQIMCQ